MDPISLIVAVLSLIFTIVGAYVAWRQWQESKPRKSQISDEPHSSVVVEKTEPTGEYSVSSVFTVPPFAGHLIGRDALLNSFIDGISTYRFNALVLEGMGGIGKTALTAALAERLGGVVWIKCSGEDITFENFVLSIAGLALKEGKSFNKLVFFNPDQKNVLKAREAIKILTSGVYRFVFDDFHLVKDETLKTFLRDILDQCPKVTFIFTSRIHLDFLEDPSIRILPRFVELKELDLDSAKEYLRYLGEVYPTLRDTNEETLKSIWQLSGMGHPIALKIFATLTRYHSIPYLLAELEQYYDGLDKWVEKLFRDLPTEEALVTSCLSVFRIPVPETAIKHLLNGKGSKEVIDRVINRFLVERNAIGEIYLHSLLLDYGNKILTQEQARRYNRLAGDYFDDLNIAESSNLRYGLEAYHHYMHSETPELAVRVVREIRKSLFDVGQYERLTMLVKEIEPYIYHSIAQEAISRQPVLFLGGGEVAHGIARTLDLAQNFAIIIDRRLSVASREADFQILLDQVGFRDTQRIIRTLQNIGRAISSTSNAHLPQVITDYYGFDARKVFDAAEGIGYRVFPNKLAALVAVDKVAFWEHFSQIAEISSVLIPRTWFSIPQAVADSLRNGGRDSTTQNFVEQLKNEVQHIGFPCVLKLAISELAYGQSVIRSNEETQIYDALHFAIQQADEHGINPGERIILEKAIEEPFFEVVQIAVRHYDPTSGLSLSFVPPILVKHVSQEILQTNSQVQIVKGPFVLDSAIQCDIRQMPAPVQEGLPHIQALTAKMIDSLGAVQGVYGVSFFITDHNIWIPDDFVVKAEDTMFVTNATLTHSAADLLTICLAGKSIRGSDVQDLRFAGGARTILWRESKAAELDRIDGELDAKSISGVHSIEVYNSKTYLRPLRLMGVILARLPRDASLTEIDDLLEQALSRVKIIPRT
ncbi:MAG TPA: hypothetical protein VK206_23115 [Anaerolineales bacterium]|nr:hypothetical protein [Anaerolineales bacterium]